MSGDQLISKFRIVNSIRSDPVAMSIIFYIYHNQARKVSEIKGDLDLPDEKIINKLEQENFIVQNPHPEDEDKTFTLSIGSNLLVKEILEEDPNLFKELDKIKK